MALYWWLLLLLGLWLVVSLVFGAVWAAMSWNRP